MERGTQDNQSCPLHMFKMHHSHRLQGEVELHGEGPLSPAYHHVQCGSVRPKMHTLDFSSLVGTYKPATVNSILITPSDKLHFPSSHDPTSRHNEVPQGWPCCHHHPWPLCRKEGEDNRLFPCDDFTSGQMRINQRPMRASGGITKPCEKQSRAWKLRGTAAINWALHDRRTTDEQAG